MKFFNHGMSIGDIFHAPSPIFKLYNKAILCYNLCGSLLASQFLSNLFPIPALYTEISDFYDDIFLPYSTVSVTYVGWYL